MITKIIKSIKFLIYRNKKFYGLSFYQLGFIPKNKNLYKLAITHRSASIKSADGTRLNNERLEFLGDAILGAVVAEALYKFFPNKDEGFLTRTRSKIVSREALNKHTQRLGLDKEIIYNCEISQNKHIYSDVFEAFIGAIYLDQGYRAAKKFIIKNLIGSPVRIQKIITEDKNYKSRLLEWGQKKKIHICYKTENKGDENLFSSSVVIGDETYGIGKGANKKEAEQNAAKSTIDILNEEYSHFIGNI